MSSPPDLSTNITPPTPTAQGIYPGWWIVFATGSGQLIQGGFVFWSIGLYTATSAPLAGYISDTTGSYEGVFWMYGGCCAVAAVGLTIMGSVLASPNT